MRIMKPRNFVAFALVVLSGAVLLQTSKNVQQAESRLRALKDSAQMKEEKARLLRAEWESLNSPERLEHLAKEFLDLDPPSSEVLVSGVSELPEAPNKSDVSLVDEEGEVVPVLSDVSINKGSLSVTVHKVEKKERSEKAFGALIDELGGGGRE